MIFYTICPLCQNVCKKIENSLDLSDEVFGMCNHPFESFKYTYVKSQNSVVIDMSLDDIYLMSELSNNGDKKTYLKYENHDGSIKSLTLNIFPFDLNKFETLAFIERAKKILEMKTFS